MFTNILTICTGNICRSPLAEAMLREQLCAAPGARPRQVRSAGIGALVGHPADATVQAIAGQDPALARSLATHQAQQVDVELARWADLILAMEPHHVDYVLRLDPTARGKTFLLGHWLGATSMDDPYLQHEQVYRETHARIAQAIATWNARLR